MQTIQNISIQVDESAKIPLFKQISEHIKWGIARNQIKPGKRLPSVRSLAQSLGVNPGTVARAYLELEQDNIIISRRGGGTIVAADSKNPHVYKLRQRHLSNLVGDNILKLLSLGYSPHELEAEFSLHLSRWIEERNITEDNTKNFQKPARQQQNNIIIVGSHDLALNLLLNKFKNLYPEINIEINYAGSLGGLIALQEGRSDLAGVHLLDEETGEYNYPYLKHLLPGRELVVVHLAYRIQGLMFAKGNPKNIKNFKDLERSDVRFVNRQKGSGTRVLLDFELRKQDIDCSKVKGYEHEVDTHLAVAMSVARGEADVGLGIQGAADSSDIDFLPVLRERYDLIIPKEKHKENRIRSLLKIISTNEFKKIVINIVGYDTSETGSIKFFP